LLAGRHAQYLTLSRRGRCHPATILIRGAVNVRLRAATGSTPNPHARRQSSLPRPSIRHAAGAVAAGLSIPLLFNFSSAGDPGPALLPDPRRLAALASPFAAAAALAAAPAARGGGICSGGGSGRRALDLPMPPLLLQLAACLCFLINRRALT
jgi:hypothetical protein